MKVCVTYVLAWVIQKVIGLCISEHVLSIAVSKSSPLYVSWYSTIYNKMPYLDVLNFNACMTVQNTSQYSTACVINSPLPYISVH